MNGNPHNTAINITDLNQENVGNDKYTQKDFG
jgi:hypothetical protein